MKPVLVRNYRKLEYLSIENIQILKILTDEIVKVMTTYKKNY